VKYARGELDRLVTGNSGTELGGEPDVLQARRLRELEEDVQRAEADLEWAQFALRRSTSV
jgi:hypothetical protein